MKKVEHDVCAKEIFILLMSVLSIHSIEHSELWQDVARSEDI